MGEWKRLKNMAKIVLRSFEELIVSEEKAKKVAELLENKNELNLPISIEHEGGVWIGAVSNIATISLSDKVKTVEHTFSSEEDLKRFHNEYGYGVFHSYYHQGYGMVDVQTQFLIKSKQAKIDGNRLVMLRNPNSKKWQDLWYVYQSKLNSFDELL